MYTFDDITPSRNGMHTSLYLSGSHISVLEHTGDSWLQGKQYLGDIPGRVVTRQQSLEQAIACLLETYKPGTEAWGHAWSDMLQGLCWRGYPEEVTLEEIRDLREEGYDWEDIADLLSDHETCYFAADIREYFAADL